MPMIADECRVNAANAIRQYWGSNLRIALVKQTFTPARTLTLADMIPLQADYSGATTPTLVLGATVADPSGDGAIPASTVTFQHNGGATGNDIHGWFAWNADDLQLVGFQLLSSPRSMRLAGDVVTVTPTFLV